MQRTTLEINSYRPRLVDDQPYQLLDDSQGFRHKFRHSYGFELDWDRLHLIARKLEKTATVFHIQPEAFMERLEVMRIGIMLPLMPLLLGVTLSNLLIVSPIGLRLLWSILSFLRV